MATVIYVSGVLFVVATMVALSHLLGERHRQPATAEVYESGIPRTGSARLRFPIHFYLVAVIFVIFDVEAVFVLAWATVARQAGWGGYLEILVFVGILVAAWGYLLRSGALDWGGLRRSRPPATRGLPR